MKQHGRNRPYMRDHIRMRLHRLLRLDDDKSAASCKQACCKLIDNILSTSLMQVVSSEVAASLQISSCNKSDLHRRTCCNFVNLTDLLQLVDKLQQAGKIHNLQQVCGVSGCVIGVQN